MSTWAPVDDPSAWTPFLDEDPAQRVWGVDAFAQGYALSLRRDGVAMVRLVDRAGSAYDVVPEHAGGMVRLGRNDDWDAAARDGGDRLVRASDRVVGPSRGTARASSGTATRRSASTTSRTCASASSRRPPTASVCPSS